MRQFILQSLLCAGLVFFIGTGARGAVPAKKQILFVCTGNHYRSRFAEALFNFRAHQTGLNWKAISRGFRLEADQHGVSPLALQELRQRGVPPALCTGEPAALSRRDMESSDYIVLMDEAEHRPMLEKQFPGRDDQKIHYWHIGDAGEMTPATACREMSQNIEELLREFRH